MATIMAKSEVIVIVGVILTIIAANFPLGVIDWLLLEPRGKEHRKDILALCQAELTMEIALGNLSSKRSPRGVVAWAPSLAAQDVDNFRRQETDYDRYGINAMENPGG